MSREPQLTYTLPCPIAFSPYRLVTASEDREVGFYAGPPFKWQKNLKEHARFVNAVRYAPDGSAFLTGGQDGKAFVYEGKAGTLVTQLGGDDGAHTVSRVRRRGLGGRLPCFHRIVSSALCDWARDRRDAGVTGRALSVLVFLGRHLRCLLGS